jgi:hypothetical protein
MNAVNVYRAVVLRLPEPELRGSLQAVAARQRLTGSGGPWRLHRRRYLVVVDAFDVAGHTSDARCRRDALQAARSAALADGLAPSLRSVMRTAPHATLGPSPPVRRRFAAGEIRLRHIAAPFDQGLAVSVAGGPPGALLLGGQAADLLGSKEWVCVIEAAARVRIPVSARHSDTRQGQVNAFRPGVPAA